MSRGEAGQVKPLWSVGVVIALMMVSMTACTNEDSPRKQGAGSTPESGSIAGILLGVGGPPGVGPNRYAGRVTVIGTELSARTQSDGRFEIAGIPPGLYYLEGRSSSFNNAETPCRSATAVSVRAGQEAKADVLCRRK